MQPHSTLSSCPLAELFRGFAPVPFDSECLVRGLSLDSRSVRPGDVFFARRGQSVDAGCHLGEAARAGAVALVVEGEIPGCKQRHGVPLLKVRQLTATIGRVAHRFFRKPSETLQVIGVTGTNGKTSVSHFIAHGLHQWAGSCGLIGTLGRGLYGSLQDTNHTTPDAIRLHCTLAKVRDSGARHLAMEVSSHGLSQERTAGIAFDVAVFTNLSRDHLDYHGDLAAYASAKRRLFEYPGLRYAVLNGNDPFSRELQGALPATAEVLDFALTGTRMWTGAPALLGELASATPDGLEMRVRTPWGQAEWHSALLGRFNAENLLASLAGLLACGMPLARAVTALASIPPVPGRMQRLSAEGGVQVVVDYAHTPDALRLALHSLRAYTRGRLWCVFGCGGDRDQGKRPQMGRIAEQGADVVVLTNDNPRSEDAQLIINDILGGMAEPEKVRLIPQREEAIQSTIAAAAKDGDLVLIAGKGHEAWQELNGVRKAFSDVAVARAALGMDPE